MKKILGLLCFAAILAVAYLTFTQLGDGGAPTTDAMESEAGEIVDQVKGMYREYGAPVLEQADEKLEDAVEQADEAIGEAVESAVEGAKQGFIQSIKESVASFFDDLTSS